MKRVDLFRAFRVRLGIAVGQHEVRGVSTAHGRIIRQRRVALDEETTLDDALLRLLQDLAPRNRGPLEPSVAAAIGPAMAQLRRLRRLPSVTTPRLMAELVRQNAGRFFVKKGVPLLTSGVRATSAVEGWAAAFEEPTIRSIVRSCEASGTRFELAVPAVVAVRCTSVDGGSVRWQDGDVVGYAEFEGNDLLSAGRASSQPHDVDSELYTDALGATRVRIDEPLAITARDTRMWTRADVARWRVLTAAAMLLVAFCIVSVVPTILTARAAARASAQLANINGQYRIALWTQRNLVATTALLNELAEFERQRRSATLLLADLTSALSQSSSIVSLRIDSAGGALTALAPRGASVLSELESVRSITASTIVGAVIAEMNGPVRLERVNLRFRWRRANSQHASLSERQK